MGCTLEQKLGNSRLPACGFLPHLEYLVGGSLDLGSVIANVAWQSMFSWLDCFWAGIIPKFQIGSDKDARERGRLSPGLLKATEPDADITLIIAQQDLVCLVLKFGQKIRMAHASGPRHHDPPSTNNIIISKRSPP
jgi:hypothetical protein